VSDVGECKECGATITRSTTFCRSCNTVLPKFVEISGDTPSSEKDKASEETKKTKGSGLSYTPLGSSQEKETKKPEPSPSSESKPEPDSVQEPPAEDPEPETAVEPEPETEVEPETQPEPQEPQPQPQRPPQPQPPQPQQPQRPQQQRQQRQYAPPVQQPPPLPQRSKAIAALFCFFLGLLGIHNFYLGRNGCGIAQLVLTAAIVGIFITAVWCFVDFILILCSGFTDRYNRPLV
jgi:hypothetical protein